MSRLIALYPKAWRDRYEAEFLVLMADRAPTPGDRLDVVRGAVDAHLNPQKRPPASPGPARWRSTPLACALAVLAGVLWMAAGFLLNGTSIDPILGYKDSGSAILLAAAGGLLAGITAFVVTLDLRGQRRMASLGATLAVGGAIAMLLPWPIVFLGFVATILGGVLFGVASTTRTGVFGILLGVANVMALGSNTEDQRALLLVPLGVAWILVGIVLAVHRIPAEVDASPVGS